MLIRLGHATLALSLCLLTACGGGGDDDSTTVDASSGGDGAARDGSVAADSGPDAGNLCMNDLDITVTSPRWNSSYGGQPSAVPAPAGTTITPGSYHAASSMRYSTATLGSASSSPFLLRILPGNLYQTTFQNGTDTPQKQGGTYVITGNMVKFTRTCGLNQGLQTDPGSPSYGFTGTATALTLIQPPGIDQVTVVFNFAMP